MFFSTQPSENEADLIHLIKVLHKQAAWFFFPNLADPLLFVEDCEDKSGSVVLLHSSTHLLIIGVLCRVDRLISQA